MSGFREGQAEPRNGTEELEHLYFIRTIVIIYQLNKNDCQLTNKIYCQHIIHHRMFWSTWPSSSNMKHIQNTCFG